MATLIDMFPERSIPYLKEKLSRWHGNLESLIDQLLSIPPAEEADTTKNESIIVLDDTADSSVNGNVQADLTLDCSTLESPKPGPSHRQPVSGAASASHLPNTYIERNYATLSVMFPEVSPVFLQEKAWEIGDNPEALQNFIIHSLEHKSSLPSRKEYDKDAERFTKEREIKTLVAADFLSEHEDPAIFYNDKTRVVTDNYKEHVRHYLVKHFPSVPLSKITQCMNENNSLLVPCMKQLISQSKGKGKGKAYAKGQNSVKPKEMDLTFLKEYVYLKLEAKIEGLKKQRLNQRREAIEIARATGGLVECGVCFDDECLVSEIVMCESGCMFCQSCVKRGAEVQIGENKVNIQCMLVCGAEMPYQALKGIISDKLYSKLCDNRQLEEIRAAGITNLVQCPACNYAVIMPDNQVKVITCANQDCGKQTCRLCGEESHIPLSCDEVEKDSEVKARTKIEDAMTEAMLRECVACKKKYFKEEGCNKMTCECGQAMCYLCRKPVSNDYKHFYGQGASPKHGLCPLWSNVSKVHADEITEAANKAKKQLGGGKLKYDPSKHIDKPKPYNPPNDYDYSDSDEEEYDDSDDYSDDEEPNEEDNQFINDDSDEDAHENYRYQDW